LLEARASSTSFQSRGCCTSEQGRQVERWLYPDDYTAWDSIFGR
jgi:hypothetical protein